MTSKYENRSETSTAQAADVLRRLGRLEAIRGTVGGVVVSAGDYATPPLTLTSGTFNAIAYFWLAARRPGIELYCRVLTPVGVTMELRLTNFGASEILSPVATIPASTNGFQGLRGRTSIDTGIGEVELQARVASGAGTCRVGVLRAIGGNFASELFS